MKHFYHKAQTNKKFGLVLDSSKGGRIAGVLLVVPALFVSIVYSIEKWTLSVY